MKISDLIENSDYQRKSMERDREVHDAKRRTEREQAKQDANSSVLTGNKLKAKVNASTMSQKDADAIIDVLNDYDGNTRINRRDLEQLAIIADVDARELFAVAGLAEGKQPPGFEYGSMKNPRNPDVPDNFTIKHDGETVYVKISPYSYMNARDDDPPEHLKDKDESGFSISLIDGGPNITREFFQLRQNYYDLKKSDIEKIAKDYLKKHGLDALRKSIDDWKAHSSEFAKKMDKFDKAEAKEDAAAKKKGMKFKVKAVVEPRAGSDFTIGWYSATKPTAAEMKKVLKSKGSESFTNYKITEL